MTQPPVPPALPVPAGPPRRLGLIGSGIDMSLAPAFHELAGRLTGLDIRYELIPQDPGLATELDDVLRRLAMAGYHGLNVTVPFKAPASRTATEPSPDVLTTGVANTLLLGPTGPTRAFNTDLTGFKWAYRRGFGGAPPGAVGLLGAGGVGTATAAALVDLGATAVRIYDVAADRSHQLANLLRRRNADVQVEVADTAEKAVERVDGVVNGTPVGMSWNPGTPVDLAAIEGQRWIFDAIYSPIETPLMVRAADAGLARITGFDLFLGQAIDAFTIFTGHDLPPPLVDELETSLGLLERERGV
jgi:shikimate dehydrogenase